MSQDLPSPPARAGATTPEGAAIRSHLSPLPSQPPQIPDHELLRRIGHGSYGEVWLARTVLGELRAVKIVHRSSFDDDRPFQREFEGLQKFAPISRSHPSQLAILHVGRKETEGYFYYVMELADPAELAGEKVGKWESEKETPTSRTPTINPETYTPKTLRSLLSPAHFPTRSPALRCPLPPAECVRIGLALAEALTHLHQHGLVHRDIKPSNIIFVGGVPKLADIGLVTDVDASRSFVGTEGYLPPEGPGTPQADIYGLGKVLYELCTGKDRKDYPALPPDLRERPESEQRELLELNAVLVKACATEPRERYQSAQAMAADLALLQRGESVKRKRAAGRLYVVARNSFVALGMLAAIIWGSFHYFTMRKSAPYMPRMSVNGEANDLYYKGLHLYQKEGVSTLHQAIQYFQQAIEKDPQFALAHAKLGGALRLSVDNPDWDLRKARHHAETALALDQNLAEAHEVLAWVKFKEDWDWLGSEREFKRAIELTPNISTPHEWYGVYLVQMGRFDEGIRELKQAQGIDPLSLEIRTFLGTAYSHSHQDRLALAELSAVIDLETNTPSVASMNLASLHEFRGDFEQAIATNARRDALAHRDPLETARRYDELRSALATNGPTGYWQKKLDWAKSDGDPFEIACLHAQLGDKDNAIASLETAFVEHSYNLGSYVMMSRALESIRSDPRFDALLRKMKLR